MNPRTKIAVPAVFLFVALSFARPSCAGDVPCSQDDKEGRGTISVTGAAREFYSPDIVMINLAVETTEKTAGGAVAENARRADKVIGALKALIGPGDTLKTSSYNIQPVYEYDRAGKKNILTGYRAIHEISVKTAKTGKAGAVIDSAIENGANLVRNIAFALAEPKKHCEDVLKAAAKSAQDEAALVAGTLGAKISGIKSISPACSSASPQPVLRYAMMEKSAAPETPIETAEIGVNASVSVVFYLEK